MPYDVHSNINRVNYVVVSLILCDGKWLSTSNINGHHRAGSGNSCNVLPVHNLREISAYAHSQEISIEKILLPGKCPIQSSFEVSNLTLLFRRKLTLSVKRPDPFMDHFSPFSYSTHIWFYFYVYLSHCQIIYSKRQLRFISSYVLNKEREFLKRPTIFI